MKVFPALALFLSIASAHAAPVQVSFSGTVSRIWYADCLDPSGSGSCSSWDNTNVDVQETFTGSSIGIGDRFFGSYVYESDAPYVLSQDGFQAVHLLSVSQFQLSINDFRLPNALTPLVSGSYSTVNDRNGIDSFYATASYSLASLFASVDFHLLDTRGLLLDDFSVPTALRLRDFDYTALNFAMLRRTDGDQIHYNGSIDTLSTRLMEVNEPASHSLMVAGLLLAGWIGQRRKAPAWSSRPPL